MGFISSAWAELFPQKPPVWTADEVPDLTGKVFLVTGGSGGIGKETIRVLLLHNATVYLAARDKGKAVKVINELKRLTGRDAIFLHLDLADLNSIKETVKEFTSKETRLDVLINNAGVMMSPMRQLTKDGYDLQFGTNVLGHFYLTKLLLPILLSTAQSSSSTTTSSSSTSPTKVPGHVRITSLATVSAALRGPLHLPAFKPCSEPSTRLRRHLGRQALYMQSKYGCLVLAQEIARRYGEKGVVSTCVNPGSARTGIYRWVRMTWSERLVHKMVMNPIEYAALNPLYVTTHPEGHKWNAQFFAPWARRVQLSHSATDPKVGEELWNWCEEQVAGLD